MKVSALYKLQFHEMIIAYSLIPFLLACILFYSGIFTYNIIKILLSLSIIAGVIFPFSILIYSTLRYTKKVIYNPILKMVELHIGRTSSQMKLALSVSQNIRIAKQMNKNILFYTNHFSEEELQKRFGEIIQIKRANIFQIFMFYFTFLIITIGMKKGERFPLLRCEINCKRDT